MPTLAEIKELKRPRWFEIEVKKVELDPEDKIMLEELLNKILNKEERYDKNE